MQYMNKLVYDLFYNMDRTASFYSRPSYYGAGFPVFAGSRRMRGGSILGALRGIVTPLLKNVGKNALKQAVGFASDVADDVISGRNFKESLKSHGKRRAINFGKSAASTAITGMNNAVSGGNNTRKRTHRQAFKGSKQSAKKRRGVKKRRTNF